MRTFFACIALLSASARVNGIASALLPCPYLHNSPRLRHLPISNQMWVANLAVRKNGQILVTILIAPALYQVDPFHTGNPPISDPSHPWSGEPPPGIVELQQDLFYIIAGNG